MTATLPLGYRHACLSQGTFIHCDQGPGKARRERCGACGGRVATFTGTWGVFVWTGTGRYPLTDAVRTFARYSAAEKHTGQDERYVVRWLPA